MFHNKGIKPEQSKQKKFIDDEDDDLLYGSSDDQDENLDDDDDDDDDDSKEEEEEEEEESPEKQIRNKRFIFTKQNVLNAIPLSDITNNYEKPWESFDSYKNVMCNLTIENFLIPLRKHLYELRKHKLDSRDLFLYENVRVHPIYDFYVKNRYNLLDSREMIPFKSNEHDLFIHFEVRFPSPASKKKINWEYSERLSKRCLLIFSTSPYMDNIQAVAYSCSRRGTVQNEVIPIRFLQGNLDITQTYYMFEPVDYWTDSIVDTLLNSSENTVPQCLIKPFLQLDFSDNSINKNLELFKFLKDKSFKQKVNVDNEQLQALKYSLDHHLTLVNGAPGTGKTHLACEVVKYLINSKYKYPILVVTYKNVSLDNFLDKISDFLKDNEVDFLRIGGRPRTKNNYILERDFKQKYPCKNLKRFLRYLISLIIIIDETLTQISEIDNPNVAMFERFINEIDKIVSIKKKLYNKYKFFEQKEESLIMNFFDPYSYVPPANIYFNCFALDKTYFEQSRDNCSRYLYNNCIKLVKEIEKYYTKKVKNEEDSEPNEIIDRIIKDHFEDDENRFYQFLSNNKEMIIKNKSNQLDILFSIIDKSKFQFKSMRLINYLKDNLMDFECSEITDDVSNDLDDIFSKKYELKTFTNFMDELKLILNAKKNDFEQIIAEKTIKYKNEETVSLGEEFSTKKLIAMTATRAAQYKESLDLSKCQFMIFEEAGELTEPITFSIIPKSVIQLMMIGDYNQLRPSVEFELSKEPFNLNISLFEKLVISSKKQKTDNLFTLSIQRRMHPQISAMLRRAFYDTTGKSNDGKFKETLIDDESVKSLGKPIGFPNHLQFWLHNFEEESDSQYKRSHSNIQEAKICARLFLMMLCRGYKSNEITIISLYKGQKKQIEIEIANLMDEYYRDEKMEFYDAFDFENDFDEDLLSLPQQERLKKIDKRNDFGQILEFRKSLIKRFVKCLDDFQGEENEVIIISLTRSEKPGFLNNRNRSLVTLSRAKQFEFIIGNKNVFGENNKINPLWNRIASQFTDKDTISYNGISACGCPIHHKNKVFKLTELNHLIECRFCCCRSTTGCVNFNDCKHPCHLSCHYHNELKENPKQYQLFERRYYCPLEREIRCKSGHRYKDICGICMHFGDPPCPNQCESKCSKCNRKCILSCGHSVVCQIGHIENYLNQIGSRLICDECKKKMKL